MKTDQKRKQQLHEKAQNDSLTFLTMFGARQKYGEIPEDVEQKLNEEILIFKNLGLAEDLLSLKSIIESIKEKLSYNVEPSMGLLASSFVAYCLGIEPNEPLESNNVFNFNNLKMPIELTINYDNEIRNNAVDWMKANGYEVSSFLGQPLLKLKNTRVIIRRVVKS